MNFQIYELVLIIYTSTCIIGSIRISDPYLFKIPTSTYSHNVVIFRQSIKFRVVFVSLSTETREKFWHKSLDVFMVFVHSKLYIHYSKANSHSVLEEISLLLWNPKFYCCVQKSPPLVHIQKQMNLVQTSYSYKISSNIILHLHLGLPNVLLLYVFRPIFWVHLIFPFMLHSPSVTSFPVKSS
jgi:hypothetical protein